jgi:hypothetical protein
MAVGKGELETLITTYSTLAFYALIIGGAQRENPA